MAVTGKPLASGGAGGAVAGAGGANMPRPINHPNQMAPKTISAPPSTSPPVESEAEDDSADTGRLMRGSSGT